MNKLKLTLALLFTALLLTAGSGLPRIIALLQDQSSLGQPLYENVPSVQLQIQKDVPTLGKLAMIDRMSNTIDISSDVANMTEVQVLEAFHAALEPYISSGLIPDLTPWNPESRVLLAQVRDMPELSGIFWNAVVSGPEKDYYHIDLAIDDETGKVLRISFTSENWDCGMLQEDVLGLFAEIYFSALEVPDYHDFATDELSRSYIGENTSATRFRFVTPDYSQVTVDLIVWEHGFYTSFHDYVEK